MILRHRFISLCCILFFFSCEKEPYIVSPPLENNELDLDNYTYISGYDDYYYTQDINALLSLLDLLDIVGEDVYDTYNSADGITWQWVCEEDYIPPQGKPRREPKYCYLDYLSSNDADIEDTIWSAVLEMQRLRTLSIQNESDLTFIPSSLADSLTQLATLVLDDNHDLTTLPDLFPPNLSYLYIDHCSSIDVIPNSIFNISTLEYLSLSYLDSADFDFDTFAPEFLNLENLETLIIRNVNLVGELPNELFMLDDLETIDISYTNLSGGLPDNIASAEDLEYLRLDHNNLSGTLPEAIGLLDDLLYLDLGHNNFSGDVPTSLCNISSVYVDDNELCGSIPSCLTGNYSNQNCNEGEDFSDDIEDYYFIDNIYYYQQDYDAASTMVSMSDLGDDFNIIASSEIDWDCDYVNTEQEGTVYLCRIVDLYFNDDGLGGDVFSEIINMDALINITIIYESNVTGSIPPEINQLTQLEYIRLENLNDFEGTIATEIGDLSNLETFILKNCNDLSGTFPSSFWSIPSLEFVDIYNINIEMQLTSGIQNATDLSSLEIVSSNLIGSIPSELFSLDDMDLIDISYTNLEGSIPEGIEGLDDIQTLRLDNNNLSGALPDGLDMLNNIATLDFQNNSLSGDIPESICSLSNWTGSPVAVYLDDNNFCGEIPECDNLFYYDTYPQDCDD